MSGASFALNSVIFFYIFGSYDSNAFYFGEGGSINHFSFIEVEPENPQIRSCSKAKRKAPAYSLCKDLV